MNNFFFISSADDKWMVLTIAKALEQLGEEVIFVDLDSVSTQNPSLDFGFFFRKCSAMVVRIALTILAKVERPLISHYFGLDFSEGLKKCRGSTLPALTFHEFRAKVLRSSDSVKMRFISLNPPIGSIYDIVRLDIPWLSVDFQGSAYREIGFNEVLESADSTDYRICEWSCESGAFAVKAVACGSLTTSKSWSVNACHIKREAVGALVKFLEYPSTGKPVAIDPYFCKSDITLNMIYQYYASILFELILGRISDWFYGARVGRWSVGYRASSKTSFDPNSFRKIPNRKNSFFADPFVFEREGRIVIFVEEYSFSGRKGFLSAVEVVGENFVYLGPILTEDFHLSFPFVFELSGILYMIPESSGNSDIRLYECTEFPSIWQFKSKLISGIDAADTMVFAGEDGYYLLTNVSTSSGFGHNSELHIFWSETFPSEKWSPIECGNPVLKDVGKARNGGYYRVGSELFRISQFHKKGSYGSGFSVNRVDSLSRFCFRETLVETIDLIGVVVGNGDVVSGAHHYHRMGSHQVMDWSSQVRPPVL